MGTKINQAKTSTTIPEPQQLSERIFLWEKFPDNRTELTPERTHRIRVFLPEGYGKGEQKYPVLYFHDGSETTYAGLDGKETTSNIFLNVVHDQQVKQGVITPAIIVAIEPSIKTRNYELTPKANPKHLPKFPGFSLDFENGGVEEYYQFLAYQLKPYLDRNFRTKTDPAHTGIGGCSFGGLASTYMGYYHPETYGMAFCISPSLWWDSNALVKQMEKDRTPKTKTKFWFNIGIKETDLMWPYTIRAAKSLLKRGYQEGIEVGFFLDYTGDHSYPCWTAMAPSMFRFFLGTQKPVLQHIKLKVFGESNDNPFLLERLRETPLAAIELNHDGDYRTNAIEPSLRSSNPKIFTVGNTKFSAIQNTLINKGHGLAMLEGQFGKFKAKHLVVGHKPYLPATKKRYGCPVLKKALDIAVPLNQWPELTYTLNLHDPKSTPQPTTKPSCKFGLWHDNQKVYIGVEVVKSKLVTNPAVMPWGQDGMEVRVDGRPDPERSQGKGEGEMQKFVMIAVSPNPRKPQKPTVALATEIPAGVSYSCKITRVGYTLQVAIDSAYFDRQQKGKWKAFRFNLGINVQADAKSRVQQYSWFPDWRSPENIPASGTFVRRK